MSTFVIGLIVFVLLFLAIRSIVKNSSCSSCGGNCPGCSSKGTCNTSKESYNNGIEFKYK